MCNGSNSRPTLINCTFTGNSAEAHGGAVYNYNGSTAILTNCTFIGNSANGDGGAIWNDCILTATDCTFSKNTAGDHGGGMWNDSNSLTVDNCALSYNLPDGMWIEGGSAQILGTVRAVSNNLAGNGNLHINPDATLSLDSCFVLCGFSGSGSIEVDADSELVIGGNAVIDLGDPNDPNAKGEIGGGTHLHIEDDAVISNAIIRLSQASFDDNVILLNCVIIVDSNGPYMPIFMEPNVSVIDCVFHVDGDRYAEMTPKGFNGVFADNKIYVTITEGMDTPLGCLFELRGKDGLVGHTCEPNEYMCLVDPCTIPDCNLDTWTIEQMDVYGKVNLTNRFPFQPPFDPGTDDDVLYARRLILHENSVFNTAYNRVYCETLVVEPNAAIVHVPLLGFSLINITFDDLGEFIVRVTHNNSENPDDPNFNRDHITRVEGNEPDPNGMMLMCSLLDTDPNSLTSGDVVSALAKGVFAKTGESEDHVLVAFEYLFVEDPCDEAELIVYLSDRPEVDVNLVEVARLRPPAPFRSGSIGSDEFAFFSGTFSSGGLDFFRGTYIQLELRGKGARCYIDNWDPMVECHKPKCGDYGMDFGTINIVDYLLLLSEVGLSSPSSAGKGCLDLVCDGVVSNDDLLAWDVVEKLHKCPLVEGASAASETGPTEQLGANLEAQADVGQAAQLLILGKPRNDFASDSSTPASCLYSVDSDGTSPEVMIEAGGNSRLVTDNLGNIYQIKSTAGLVRQDATPVVSPGHVSFGGSLVVVGYHDIDGDYVEDGPLLSDAAFSPYDSNIVYLAPVQVIPPVAEGCPYVAAAKLELTGGGNYSVLRLYGLNPVADPNQTRIPDCEMVESFVYEPDVQHLHELEIDPYGNLFVLSFVLSGDANDGTDNNWLLIYDEAVGNDSEIRVLLNDPCVGAPNLAAPAAMVVSSAGDKLYLASSANTTDQEPNDLVAHVYRFSIDSTDHNATGLAYDGCVDVCCPEPNLSICEVQEDLCQENCFVAKITSMAQNPDDGTVYATGYTSAKFTEVQWQSSQVNTFFTTPMLAVISPDSNLPVEAVRINSHDPDLPLMLPLSMVWTASINCTTADITGEGTIDLEDFAFLAQHWLDSDCMLLEWCQGADLNKSNSVDWRDLSILAKYWLDTECFD
jgi:hypothetical protein